MRPKLLSILFFSIILLAQTNKNTDTSPVGTKIIEMIFVKGGSFQMGTDVKYDLPGSCGYKILKDVTVDNFYISKYEITRKLYKLVTGKEDLSKINESNHPVTWIDWDEAIYFCNKLSELDGLKKCYEGKRNEFKFDSLANGYRLLTEAEWEYAARGGNKSNDYKYSGSDIIEDVAWYAKNSMQMTHCVGEKQPNELGIYDMSGNVSEWCWDLDSLRMGNKQEYRIFKGGSFESIEQQCRVYYYTKSRWLSSGNDRGFRVARSSK